MASLKNLRSSGLAGLAVLTLVLAGCSQNSDPNTWDEADAVGEVENNFVSACTEADEGRSEVSALASYCGCAYDALRQEYDADFDGFVKLNRDLGNDPAAIPPNVSAIFTECASTYLGS